MKGRIQIVSASAGSGKTTRLASELERAITELGIAPDRIVATTFTRKAAAELVERGRQTLLRAGRADDAELFRAARIGTVNAVAGMLVSDFAFEAGISPELIVLDEARSQEAFRRSLGEVVTQDDLADLGRLAANFDELPWQSIVRQISDAVRTNHISTAALDAACEGSVSGFFELLDPPLGTAAELDSRLEAALSRASTDIRSRVETGVDKTKKSAETLEVYVRVLHRLRGQRAIPWTDWASLTTREAAAKTDPLCDPVRQVSRSLLGHPSFRADCELAIRTCFGLAERALTAYQRFKKERRAIDFVDQETIAFELLQRQDVQAVLSEEISLVLVDEFQDVSPLQLALFLSLARVAPTSVWVGDQKQAIYGFRGADPSLMEAVVSELLQGKEPETLNVGRRSRAPLVDLTNALFVPPFGEFGLPEARVTLEPALRDDPPSLGPCVERWRLDAPNADDAANMLASSVRHLLDDEDVHVRDRVSGMPRRVLPADVAILCRRRETALAVSKCLGEVGVSSEVARAGLLGTLEGRIVAAALRLWVDPSDMLARAELAKSLERGGADLAVLVRGDDVARWNDLEAITALTSARAEAPLAGALEAFDRILDTLRLEDVLAGVGRGGQGTANLDALRAHAVNFTRLARQHGGASSPSALVAHLLALAADTEDAQGRAGNADAVSITTWHAAKGLEWPVVILYELDGAYARTALGVHVDRQREAVLQLDDPLSGRTIRYWPSPFHPSTSRTPFHDRLRAHVVTASASEAALREELRLLYVGWTRARDRLVLASRRDLASGTLSLFARGGGSVPSEPAVADGASGLVLTEVTWGGNELSVGVRRPPQRVGADKNPRPASPEILVRPEPRHYPPAWVRPSDLERVGIVRATERIGPSLTVAREVDPSALGTAVHAFLAADRSDLDEDDRAELASRLLSSWSVEGALTIENVTSMSRRFRGWVATRWPSARVRHEWPVEHRLPEGTIVRGTIDVAVETETSLAVIDHKIIAAPEANAIAQAAGYAGQVGAYAAALRAASPSPTPVELVIHLPLTGVAVWLE